MCTTNIYSYVHQDGRKETTRVPNLCSFSRGGKPCANNVVFQHPSQYLSSSYSGPTTSGTSSSSSSPYIHQAGQFPPTPTYTPRSSTPNYRSGDESDRSYGSYHSSGSQSRKRSSGVYVNGQKVADINGHSRRDSQGRRGERIVLVESPPTPRTPPQSYTAPRSTPSSPNANLSSSSSRRESISRRPVIVDERPSSHSQSQPIPVERPRVHIEVVDNGNGRSSGRHSRQASTSSHDSRRSYSSAADHQAHQQEEDERRLRRERRREEKRREEQEIKDQRIRARIARANAEIANRPAAPMPPPPPRRSSTSYSRPAVEIPVSSSRSSSYDRRAEQLAETLRRLDMNSSSAAARAERDEEEAQRQRLIERMTPRRRSTVGGNRRHRVSYDDGTYRWE